MEVIVDNLKWFLKKRLKSSLIKIERNQGRFEGYIENLSTENQALKKMISQLEERIVLYHKHQRKLSKRISIFESRIMQYETKIAEMINNFESNKKNEIDQSRFSSDQEAYWHGQNGIRYVFHHLNEDWQKRIPIWREILSSCGNIESVIELGCNIGANLKAISKINDNINLTGVEINQYAVEEARKNSNFEIVQDSLLTFETNQKFDLSFVRGVFIHINPSLLPKAYERLYELSKKYILIFENYSQEPYELSQYAHSKGITLPNDKAAYQFWRDFADDFLKKYPECKIVQEGCEKGVQKKDRKQGELWWTLIEKN